jgi:hypothetical protein
MQDNNKGLSHAQAGSLTYAAAFAQHDR